jgi:hypothetical protein
VACQLQLQNGDAPAAPADDARMTTEQVKELGEALSVLSAKSSVLKERDELPVELGQRDEEVGNLLSLGRPS